MRSVLGVFVLVGCQGQLEPAGVGAGDGALGSWEGGSAIDGGAPLADAAARVGPRGLGVCPSGPDPARMAGCGAGVVATLGNRGFVSVADAVLASRAGDTVVVCPGVHRAGLAINHDLDLVAADPTPGVTGLVGGRRGRVIAHGAGALRVEGLTLRGGRARDGGAIMSSGDLTLSCSVFSDNEADYEGGAVSSAGALEVRGCSFHDNYADYGGGAISARGVTTIVDTELHENEAGYEGGAVVASSGLRITRAAFVGNFADYSGGAVEFGSRVDETLALEDTLFRDNEAGYEGGAVGFGSWASDRLIARRTWFVGNMAGSGAAIELGSWGAAALVMEDCEVRDNEATGGSAAIDFGGWLRQGGSARLARTTFTNNTARSGASVLATNSRAAPVDVTAFAIRVLRNVGTDAAFALEATDPMRCRRCDFGQGANDNAPGDVRHGGSVSGQAPMNFTL